MPRAASQGTTSLVFLTLCLVLDVAKLRSVGAQRRLAAGILGFSLLVSTVAWSSSSAGAAQSCVPGPGVDLAGCNLSNARLSNVNLKVADLAGATLAHARLRNANLTGANLTGADLTDANLTGAHLRDANLTGTRLTGADLFDVFSGAITGVPTSLPTTGWRIVDGYLFGLGANLNVANLSGINLSGAFLKYAYFIDSNLTGANLSNAYMRRALLNSANLTNADLEGADLTNARLKGAHWSNTTCPDGSNSDRDHGTCVNNRSIAH